MNDNEQCTHCLSRTYFLIQPNSLGWECWNCQAKHWIDDECRLSYMVMEDIDGETAEQALIDGNVALATILDCDLL